MTTRRAFLASFIAATAAPGLSWASAGNPSYLAAAREADGGFALFGIGHDGQDCFRVPLPARGHAGAGHPSQPIAVAFARRPGKFALVINCAMGRVTHQITSPEGSHFNGHGVFDPEGDLLFTCEQRASDSEGFIGIWNASQGYERIGEMRSHGVGPHDLLFLSDGETLVVANGGIATNPETREKLNIDDMHPNLTYLSSRSGAVLDQVALEPELAQNSIRHLALTNDDTVAFAMQWEGDTGMAPPLLGLHRRGSAPVLAEAPLGDELAMDGYAGSVSFSGDGSSVAITSPKGGRIHRFATTGEFLGAVSRSDVCGLARHRDGFIASDGLGGLIRIKGDETRPLTRQKRAWDNHIVELDQGHRPT